MLIIKWDDLPEKMKNENVRKYYEILYQKRKSLFFKRVFDIVLGIIILLILSPLFLAISVAIKVASPGPVIFKQTRVTQYGKMFSIFKFRTMVVNAETLGSQITTSNDCRITKIGCYLRKTRLDELPQLLNIIKGDMSFVGTRPEVVSYVEQYTDEMMATLLLPAGVTSNASIQYIYEEKLLVNTVNVNKTYIGDVLPEKMIFNLRSIEKFSLLSEIKIMVRTIAAVLKKNNITDAALEETNAIDQTENKGEITI